MKRSVRLASLTAATVAVLAGLAVGGWTTASASPTPPVPFACTSSTVFFSQGQQKTQLYSAPASTPPPFTPIGAKGSRYNALGYNSVDHLLYATSRGSSVIGPGHLVAVDSTGTEFDQGALPAASASALRNGYIAGTFGDGAQAGTYYATDPSVSGAAGGVASSQLYVDPISPPGAATTITMSKTPLLSDWTYAYGFLWGVDERHNDRNIARVDPTTGVVTEWPNTVAPRYAPGSGHAYGASWTFAPGPASNQNLWFYNDGTGKVYEVGITNPTGAPTFNLVHVTATHHPGYGSDGTACTAG